MTLAEAFPKHLYADLSKKVTYIKLHMNMSSEVFYFTWPILDKAHQLEQLDACERLIDQEMSFFARQRILSRLISVPYQMIKACGRFVSVYT